MKQYDKDEEARKKLRDEYRPANDHYECECAHCGRQRVELLKNGKRICEKCFVDHDTGKVDHRYLEFNS
jgi:ribosomal protein L37AE/L43A